MDYRFYYNERQLPCAALSMDHEAFGLWLTDDLSDNSEQLDELLDAITRLEDGRMTEYEWQGHNFVLYLTREDADITARELLQEHSRAELDEEDMDFYDAESRASCGLDDLRELLIEWLEFVQS
ncbi:MAG: hypothetical protein CMI02_03890 [Oceanospirillaceae bacterium]|nr:hypothetical protein [Oceanospirillaceae bacterium]MBT10541.1 hypothetical protein [Oceanospirillaceae bacterium]MBT11161.1 hypothetical protein [Oceanospirillaceae bacterium]|tara:strand:+ start:140557 stop:140928 length:372 start_codon:yes stop_codon:yes gene_type:complete